MKKKSFTKEEKLRIIKETTEKGIQTTLTRMAFIKRRIMLGKAKMNKWVKRIFSAG